DGDHLVELLLGHLAHSRVAGDAGVVDHDVERPEPLHRRADQRLHLIGPGHIATHPDRDVRAAEAVRRGPGGRLVDVADHHPRALGDEPLGDRVAETPRSARDHCCLAGQQRHLITPSFPRADDAAGFPTSYLMYDIRRPGGVAIAPPGRTHKEKPMSTAEVSDEDFRQILRQTREFVRTAVVPRELEILNEDRVPDDLREQAKQMGLFGYAIPQQWGGLGLDLAQDVELAMELGYTSLALRSMFGTNNGIAGQVLVGFGTEEQKARWLEPIASGEVVASFALTEPGAGSNPAGLRSRAVRDGSGADADWIINGQKRFITNAPVADLFV